MEVNFDMDGVLADFSKAINSSPGINNMIDTVRRMIEQYPRCCELGYHDMISDVATSERYGFLAGTVMLADSKDSSLGVAANECARNNFMRLLYSGKNLKRAKYRLASAPGFFLKLDVMPDADVMVDVAIDMCDGRLPDIITAPIHSSKTCVADKRAWMDRHFHGKYRNFYATQDKWMHATPTKVLIDDREKFLLPWREAGGSTILHENVPATIAELSRIMFPTPTAR